MQLKMCKSAENRCEEGYKLKDADKAELQKAMDGHILNYGTLTGNFGE